MKYITPKIRTTFYLCSIYNLFIVLFGCASCSNRDYMRLDDNRIVIDNHIYQITDDLYEEEECMCIPQLDSIETAVILDKLIVTGMLLPDKEDGVIPSLYDPLDLSLLPYYIISINSPKYTSAQVRYAWDLLELCTSRYNDPGLLEFGKALTYNYFRNNNANSELLNEILSKEYSGKKFSNQRGELKIDVDSLRVRTIIYNDRDALNELEQYYNQMNRSKEIAIYYRILLTRAENNDLVEKYVHLINKYFTVSEFRSAVREVLLRAAHCDNDRRAQELCDSLGFSLCDYRLPLPTDIDARNLRSGGE